MSITASDDIVDAWSYAMMSPKIRGLSATHVVLDEWHDDIFISSPNFADYQMRRLGKKRYAFYREDASNWGGSTLVARYKCSHLEAARRFRLLLVTRRMLAN